MKLWSQNEGLLNYIYLLEDSSVLHRKTNLLIVTMKPIGEENSRVKQSEGIHAGRADGQIYKLIINIIKHIWSLIDTEVLICLDLLRPLTL